MLIDVHQPTQADSKQPSLRATITAVISAVVITVFVFGSLLLLALWVPGVRDHFPVAVTIAIWVHASLILTAVTLIVRRDGVSLKSLGFVRPGRRLLHLFWQIPATLVAVLVVQGVVFLVLSRTPSPSESSSGLDSLFASTNSATIILIFLGIAVLTPLWEEAIFRGMIFGTARTRRGTVAAVFISASVFALVHGVPILLPYLITAGIALGLLRAFHRNLWGPLALHMTVNSIASASLLAAVLR